VDSLDRGTSAHERGHAGDGEVGEQPQLETRTISLGHAKVGP
jgi:hypothetical protein